MAHQHRLTSPLRTALCCLPLLAACASAPKLKDFNTALAPGAHSLIEVTNSAEWPDLREGWWHRDELMPALERSIDWTDRKHAEQFHPIEGITHAKALESLQRFREVLLASNSAEEFERSLEREFRVFKSAGWDGEGGGVLFTAYYTPILDGSLEQSTTFAYPLYSLPSDLEKGPNGEIRGQRTEAGLHAYPDRHAIEASGLLAGQGLELVWFQSPLDAFIAHVNGSAFVRLPDGEMARFGYAGNNGLEYTSLAKELVKAGELDADSSGLAAIRAWAAANPTRVEAFLERNERYVFFTPISGNPRGSLNLEVEAGRSLATDKTIFPRGALVFTDTHTAGATMTDGPRFSRFMLDQDTGGAIRTAGRADIYLGVGERAEQQSGEMKAEGQLYYLFLR